MIKCWSAGCLFKPFVELWDLYGVSSPDCAELIPFAMTQRVNSSACSLVTCPSVARHQHPGGCDIGRRHARELVCVVPHAGPCAPRVGAVSTGCLCLRASALTQRWTPCASASGSRQVRSRFGVLSALE